MKIIKHLNESFSKSDTTLFKGFGILFIILHNFFHNHSGMQIENEFTFDAQNIYRFVHITFSTTFLNFVSGVFSFLGHYGVQIFFFFSAYGLTKQYEKGKRSDYKFVLIRLKKIYFLMAYGVLICVIILAFVGVSFGFFGTLFRFSILASTLNNFTTISLFSGPFWFFAPVIQFYILFPFLYRLITRTNIERVFIPILLSILLIYLVYYTIDGQSMPRYSMYQFSLFRNVFGHLPELLLGIIMAHFRFKSFSPFLIILSFVVFLGSQVFEGMFPLSFIITTILLVSIIGFLINHLGGFIRRVVLYLGQVSMILFVVNSPFRLLFYHLSKKTELSWGSTVLFFILLFTLCHVLYLLYVWLTNKLKI